MWISSRVIILIYKVSLSDTMQEKYNFSNIIINMLPKLNTPSRLVKEIVLDSDTVFKS